CRTSVKWHRTISRHEGADDGQLRGHFPTPRQRQPLCAAPIRPRREVSLQRVVLIASRGLMRTTLYVARQSAQLFAAFAPSTETGFALREFQNKLEVFDLFENVDLVLRLPAETRLSLEEMLKTAKALDPFTAVWVTEGIGHFYAESAWESRG